MYAFGHLASISGQRIDLSGISGHDLTQQCVGLCVHSGRIISSFRYCGWQGQASSWGECEVESLMSTCRSRITDLRGRFPSTRHKHVGSQPSYSYSRASLSMVDSMLGWLAVVFSSFVKC